MGGREEMKKRVTWAGTGEGGAVVAGPPLQRRRQGGPKPHARRNPRGLHDRRDGSGHCGRRAHTGGDRATWRSIFEASVYGEGARVLRTVQEQGRTVCGTGCGKSSGTE